jgi:transcriptional regulator with XRE-family HTH domain
MLTGMQIRLARAALRWRVDDLADASGISWARIQQMEREDDVPSAPEKHLKKVRKIFEEHGIVFLDQDKNGLVGVQFAPPAKSS